MKSEGEVKDLDIHCLREFLELMDAKLHEIDTRISQSVDPDADGLLDRGEYFIGVGFVAIQQHVTESLIGIKLSRKESFSLGTTHPSGVPSISVINAAANWWKHEAEWFKNGELPKNGEQTYNIIMNISNRTEYALSNVLASFSDSQALTFIDHVIPHIEQWTKAICIKNEESKTA